MMIHADIVDEQMSYSLKSRVTITNTKLLVQPASGLKLRHVPADGPGLASKVTIWRTRLKPSRLEQVQCPSMKFTPP